MAKNTDNSGDQSQLLALSQQELSFKFSEECLYGFAALNAKTENGLVVCKDVSEFFRKRAAIEDEYPKKLAALYKAPIGAGIFSKDTAISKETKTLATALNAVLEKGLVVSEQHQDFANKLINQVCKPLDAWGRTKDSERKKIVGEGQKHVKNLADSRSNSQKAKASYEKMMKEGDTAKDAFFKAEKDEVNQPENKKLQVVTKKASQQHTQIMEKAKSLETQYKSSVQKANEDLEQFKSKQMPTVVDQLGKWDEERWNLLLGAAKSFVTIQEPIPPVITKQIEELNGIFDSANINDDFKEFVEANSKKDKEEPLEFVAFKSKHETEDQKPIKNSGEIAEVKSTAEEPKEVTKEITPSASSTTDSPKPVKEKSNPLLEEEDMFN